MRLLTGVERATLVRWFPRELLWEVQVHELQRWLEVFRFTGGGEGLTLGRHIYCRHWANLPFLVHELVHVQQQQHVGLARFLWLYLREWAKLKGRPISEHPFEEPAYRLQYEVGAKMRHNPG